MAKRLSILLLYNNEPMNLSQPMLDSLENQIGFNWDDIELLICSSSANVNDIDLTSYPNLTRVAKRVKYDAFAPGPGASWQLGMDSMEGEYMWRIDIDDVLVDKLSIFYVLYNLNKHNNPNVLILSCIGPDGIHQATTELPNGVPIPMAPFLWVVKTEVLRKEGIRLFPYTMVWEDVNFATILWDNVDNNTNLASTEEVVYEHFDRKDSTFYTQYRYKPLKIIQENYFQLIHNIDTYNKRNVYVPTQVFWAFMYAYKTFFKDIKDEYQKEQAKMYLKILMQRYPTRMLWLVKKGMPINQLMDIYNKCILLHITEDTTLDNFRKILTEIEHQKESSDLDLSKVQIICYDKIDKIKDYDCISENPLLYPNIIKTDISEVQKLFVHMVIPEGVALLLETTSGKINSWNFTEKWFKNS